MDILIAGKGFIGSAVGKELEQRGNDVKYLDRKNASYTEDITEEFEIDEEFDTLVHAIGLAPGFNTAKEYEKVHLGGTENLLDAVDTEKIIFFSALKAGDVKHSFFRTKRQAENLIEESGPDHLIVRPSTVFGRGNKLLEMIRKFSFTRIFPDIKTETQPIRKEDLAKMTAEAIERGEKGILKAAGPEKMTMGVLAEKIYNEEGKKCFLIPYPQFLLEMKLVGLSFLPPPFQRENIQILRHDNTTENNGAKRFVGLRPIPGGKDD